MLFERDIEGCTLIAADTEWLHEQCGSYEAALEALSPTRRDKALSYKFDKDRELSVLSSMLLDRLLSRRGMREKNMSYVESDLGKPSFEGYPELCFSIAHSGEMALAMLGDAPVGVDVEHLPGFPRELADPFQWTEMESVGKLLGCGVGCYVDGERFEKPSYVETQHIPFEEYLFCIAWKNRPQQLDYRDENREVTA